MSDRISGTSRRNYQQTGQQTQDFAQANFSCLFKNSSKERSSTLMGPRIKTAVN